MVTDDYGAIPAAAMTSADCKRRDASKSIKPRQRKRRDRAKRHVCRLERDNRRTVFSLKLSFFQGAEASGCGYVSFSTFTAPAVDEVTSSTSRLTCSPPFTGFGYFLAAALTLSLARSVHMRLREKAATASHPLANKRLRTA